MSNTDRSANDLKQWEETTTSIAANAADLPQTEIPRAALEKMTDELRKLVVQQKLFQSQKQQTSARMAEIHAEGSKRATVLRVLVKQHYGNRSEKLVELGVQPLRSRSRKAVTKPEMPTPTTAAPTASASPAAK